MENGTIVTIILERILNSTLKTTLNSLSMYSSHIPKNTTLNASLATGRILATPEKEETSENMMGNRIETVRIIIYSLIIIVAFIGNGMLVLTMTFTKKMKTTTNYFLLNMAIGDLLVAVLCAPYQLASWKIPSIKTFDRRICKTMPFIQMSTVGISIFTMVAIAIVRYRAVLSPLRKHSSKRSSIIIIIIVWLSSFVAASPMIFVYEIDTISTGNNTQYKRCDEYGWANPKTDAAAYTYVLFILEYALPGLLSGCLYLRIFLNLWFHSFPGMQNMSQATWQRFRKKHYRRKKTVVMLLTIFLTFMVCNLPMHVISFIYYVQGSSFKEPPYMHVITTCAEMIMYANSAVNPILYGFMHSKFRASAKGLLRWVFCGDKRPNYESIPFQKKEKQMTLVSGATSTSMIKGDELNKPAETRF